MMSSSAAVSLSLSAQQGLSEAAFEEVILKNSLEQI